ncbi:MAG: hypothetical protein ACRC92_15110, partial [Peptostreptococcaceae bacterium]
FKGIDYLTNLTYMNFAGCLYDGVLRFKNKNIEKLDFAFADMPNLISITFESPMTTLKTISYAFADSPKLTSIILPNAINLENANYTFKNCLGITDIITNNLNNNLKYMNGTFSGCVNLRTLKLQTAIPSLLEFDNIFQNCYIENVAFINNENITKTSEITLFDEAIKIAKRIDLSNLINISQLDSTDGENTVVQEFNLNNTKLNILDITGAYLNEPDIEIDEVIKYGF